MKEKKLGLATNSIMLAFVRCVTYASSFAQTMIMSRVFSKFEYGTYSQACLIVSFTSPFLLLGLSNAVNYFYNQKDTLGKNYLETIYNMILVLGLFGGLVIIILHNPIANYFSNSALIPAIYIIAFRPLLQNLISTYQVIYISENKASAIAIRNAILAIMQFLIAIIAAYLCKSFQLVLILLVVTDLVQVAIFYLHCSLKIVIIRFFKIDYSLIPKILTYAFPLALSTMVGTLSVNMDTMLIGKMMSTEMFALYTNMAKELPFNFIVSSFTDVVFPRIINLKSKDDKEKLIYLYSAYLEIGITVTWILVIGAIVCAKEIVITLYSEEYLEGINIFVVYLFVSALRFTYYGMILSAYGKSKEILKYSILTLICNFVLNIVLFHFLGIIGPAIATLISVCIPAVLQMKKGLLLLGYSVDKIFDYKYLIKLILELMLVGVILGFVKENLINLPILARLLIFYFLYVGILFVLNYKRLKSNIRILNHG